ncbi:MAG: threonylcarbamoyl-AMP synthase [Clostridiales bacterium]|jgi:L-threonylcarbamoyladenylate synthase|nr:threonylcarbamoyl-AMP synthase [Clostridiales bacterium]
MNTIVKDVDPLCVDKDIIREAASIILSGGLVAFPTETVYGLGASCDIESAVRDIYAVKCRPTDNPLILHIADASDFFKLTVNTAGYVPLLIEAFCPGPLTLVAKSARKYACGSAGLDTIAIRMPNHPVALELIKQAGAMFAPSANISGGISPTTAAHVLNDLKDRVHCVLNGGACAVGIESTVADVTGDVPRILRPGAVTANDIASVVGACDAFVEPIANNNPFSGGIKYTRYAPKANMRVVTGHPLAAAQAIIRLAHGKNAGVLATAQTMNLYPNSMIVINLGDRDRPEKISANLYKSLRELDAKVDYIFAEGIDEASGGAVMDRLLKAARGSAMPAEEF